MKINKCLRNLPSLEEVAAFLVVLIVVLATLYAFLEWLGSP